MGKEICKNKKKLKKNPELLASIVSDPQFVCEKCGRAARKKKYLCRARKIKPGASLRVA